MTALAKGNEPSMEEILASIRRIIADDPQVVAASPEAETAPAAPPMPKPDDVLDLAVAATPVPQDSEDDAKSQDDVDLMFADVAPEPKPEPEPARAPPPVMVTATPPPPPVVAPEHQPEPRSELLSAATSASIAGAFSSLSNTLLTGNARTLEDLVKDMMKPMLKTWLDDNLPSIVERLVKAEIERVARGGR
jgi:cell pole-organizing protein PopZ